MSASMPSNRREFLRLSAAGAIGTAIAAALPAAQASAAARSAPTAALKAAPAAAAQSVPAFAGLRKTAVQLKEVDEVRVTTLLDNYVELNKPSTAIAKRPPPTADVFFRPMLRGEHGFSTLITVRKDEGERRIILDTGSSETGIFHNADGLGIDLSTLDAIVISHNHFDHTAGTVNLLARLGSRRVRFVAHPYAFLEHRFPLGGGVYAGMPPLRREILQGYNVDLIETAGPTLLEGNSLLVSGEVARTTSFELGLPGAEAKLDDQWQVESLCRDDQSVAVNLRGKGLVVVAGCAHAGIVNTIKHLQAITGIERVYAVIGGLHLQNPAAVAPTVAAIKEMAPQWVVPTHCTGFAGILEFVRVMPDAFVQNTVGTTIQLTGAVA
jgi:7,8-dihydropterin-6-yl-methyl-4-(beta-D-ribofuranosyl)aminobenzene 5'-phosphate synthase